MKKQTENYLTQSPFPIGKAFFPWLAVFFLGTFWTSISFGSFFEEFFWANGVLTFQQNEYWRLFTAIFSHKDFGHLAGNAFLLLPLTYLMLAYFPFFYFLSFFLAALTNLLTLQFYPSHVFLLGSSGWVFVLGGAWLSFFLWIDHRERWPRRWGSALFLGMMLFVPDQIQSDVSYLSHFFGFVLGAVGSSLYFWLRKNYYKQFIVIEAQEEIIDFEQWNETTSHFQQDSLEENSQTSSSIPSRERTKSTWENLDRKSKLI